jgi:hypothetical protein
MTRSPRPDGSRRSPRLVFAAALATVLVAVGALPAGARPARPDRVATGLDQPTDTSASDRTLVATGTARVRGVPDVLTMTLGVTTRGDSVGDALGRNNATVAKVMDVLTDGGVDKKDVQTSNFSISPVYDDDGTDIDGYQASNLVTVQLRDLAEAGGLIDEAAGAGGDDVVMRGVSFGFDDTSALVAQARAEAVKRARTQAEQLSEAAGVALVEVRTISESSVDAGPVLAAPETSARAADSVPISPGTEELTVHVTVVYTIR